MTRLSLAAACATLLAMPAGADTARVDYILHCSGCHGMAGMGAPDGGIPPFPDSVGQIAALDFGRTYIMHVPGVITTDMSDARIAAVTNYILDHWADGENHFTADEVTRRRALPVPDIVAARREVVRQLDAAGVTIADYPWP